MSTLRTVFAIARADFLERVRRYSFLVTLVFAVCLGYAAATGKVLVLLDDYCGVYTAGWIGMMMTLVTTTFVSMIGFYVVKNAVDRDRTTRVGQILAATPLSRFSYFLGKLASNFGVLSSVVLILAAGAVVMYFIAGEEPPFDLWALLSPFLFLALPMMALTSALALVFESIRFLRGGFGNVVWVFAWSMLLGLPEITGHRQLDPIGMIGTMKKIQPAARAAIPGYKDGVSLTLNPGLHPKIAENLHWAGFPWTAQDILLRFAWVLAAVVLMLLASLLFDRFDSAVGRTTGGKKKKSAADASVSASARASAAHLTPLVVQARSGSQMGAMITSELRLALQGYRWWWYMVALGLLIAQFLSPLGVSRGPLLGVAWLWPALIWSAMGGRENRYGVGQLIFSSARILPRQVPACWIAGFAVALLTGAGAVFRLAIARDFGGLFGVLAGAVFIPSLALGLGVVTGSSKFFEGFYTFLWYIGPMNHTSALDYTGAANGSHVASTALVYLAISAGLMAAAFLFRARQLRGN